MRFAIISVLDENVLDKKFEGLRDVGVPNKQRYCDKHGYEFRLYGNLAPDRCIHWSKYFGALDAMKTCEWIFVMHMDNVIVNTNIKLENLMERDHDFYVCNDNHGLNDGQFLVKSSDWARTFLRE